MNPLNRLLQLVDKFVLCVDQLSLAESISIFSYVWGSDSLKCISANDRNFYFQPKSDKGVLSLFYKEGYRISGDPKIIFDVGANIGDATLRFRAFHPFAKIVAIEPSARNFEILRKNFASDPNVFLFNSALWHSPGKLHLKCYGNPESFSIFECNSEATHVSEVASEVVDAVTVSDILSLLDLKNIPIDIFKIDVEGAEKFIFCQGDNQWIARVNVFIMEIPDNDLPGSFQQIYTTLSSFSASWFTYICGENIVLIRKGSGFSLHRAVGLDGSSS
jgi:FkbM family methyltransferase